MALNNGFAEGNKVIRSYDREVFHQPLYDRKNIAAGSLTGETSWFNTPVGGADTVIRYETAASVAKTKRDTNLPSNGQDPGKDYSLFGMSIAIIPGARGTAVAGTPGIRRDKDNIKEGGWLNFKVIDKNILDLPLIMVPELNAEGGVASTANNATIFLGPQFSQPMWSFGDPIRIDKGTNFSVVCRWDGTITLSQTYDMYVIFFAKVRRPV